MRITYTAPFRLPFNLPKDTLLTHHSTWVSHFEQAQKHILHNTILGNYGWGLLNKLHGRDDHTEGGQRNKDEPHNERIHGQEGIEDPTWFFRDYYILCFGEAFSPEVFGQFLQDPALSALFAQSNPCQWQCRIIDEVVKSTFRATI